MRGSTGIRARLSSSASALAVLMALSLASLPATGAQKYFESPQAATNAFGMAVTGNDEGELRSLFGDDFRAVIPPVGADLRQKFLNAWQASHSVQQTDAQHAVIAVGNDGWTFPIPLARTPGGWHFDLGAGVETMRLRRIGQNELAAIQTMLAIYDAQREYASAYHDGSKLYAYADRLASSPGKHDGLYWPTGPGEEASPLGAAFLTAGARNATSAGYNGYHYRLLRAQGPHAAGGAYDYMVNGRLFGGFAVIAWPARYGDTGIKSFIVSHDGQVYSRDLGQDSAKQAEAMRMFDPGPGWEKESP